MATLVTVVQGAGMFGAMMSLPLYLQIVKGATPTQAGLQMLPPTLGIMVASLSSGRLISKTGRYKMFAVAGIGLMAAALFALSTITVDTSLALVMVIAFVIGFGLGASMQTLVLAATNDVRRRTSASPPRRRCSSGRSVARRALWCSSRSCSPWSVTDRHCRSLGEGDPGLHGGLAPAPGVRAAPGERPRRRRPSFLSSLDPVLARPILQGFAQSMSTRSWRRDRPTIGSALVRPLKEKPLSDKSAMEQRSEAEEAAAPLALAH